MCSASGDVLVEARQIARSFRRGDGEVAALAPLSFTIRPRDRIAVVGPSGSGKTTLLHLIAGLDEPTSGALDWPGLGSKDQLRTRQIGVVFQSASLMPALTSAENVALPILLGEDGDDGTAAAMRMLATLDLAALADRLPEELSGGQAQRVAMARAMVTAPRLLLADEPTGQLDHVSATLLLDHLLAFLDGSDTALVLATHDPAVMARMDRVWQLDHGRLVPDGREG
ncbi:ABC transporter ATP-binding protein [Kaistia sp. 32K]|uniref:ABC transporter ATP-binding protein n=1 Tax=Kaistia sp. 32K TaxID=2795690 RepID=UPI001914E33C|nr:ABC transporter ATP-binding protein [Kaistia sp. 32K]BCP54867.1 ABC transporter ATP-binding protein [Kaistia sp. 32K]